MVNGLLRGEIGIRNRHAEVHGLAAGNDPVHRSEIEQIAHNDLRTHVTQRLGSSLIALPSRLTYVASAK
jgi:hypothetical protein